MVQVLFENESEYTPQGNIMNMLKNVMQQSIESEKYNLDVEISLTFTTDQEIKIINEKYRSIDKATDVLSFPMYEPEELEAMNEKKSNKPVVLGDIVVSVERAKNQAKEYGHSFEREMAFLICHSMFHLLGYDHLTKEDERIMFDKQKAVLLALDINR